MRLLHIADLHLGKRVSDFSMIDDQKYILSQITDLAENCSADGLLIAGDIYDKAVPTAEAVCLFDSFLSGMSRRGIPVFAISGNHDSAERLAFGAGLMKQGGAYFSPVFSGAIEPVIFNDIYGEVCIWMMPFLRLSQVKAVYGDSEIANYTAATAAVIAHMSIKRSSRNVLLAHQFVTGAERCESEEISVGGLDNVDEAVFEPFDYVALGHIHGPQFIGRETVRYSGSPLKYSFSEEKHIKSAVLIELGAKGQISLKLKPLKPLRDMKTLRGSFEKLTAFTGHKSKDIEDYIRIILTDEEDVPNAIGRLRALYPNVMRLDYDNTRTRSVFEELGTADAEKRPAELFGELYEKQNGRRLDEEQEKYLEKLISDIWEDEK
ncbi:MAG: exonuclease SbcCD subunit D [Clostridiaceae bacterium]|nr:exonuclease SbcCD subunit D [Clostridiaceae bacterium]